jgi:hypothetical protein
MSRALRAIALSAAVVFIAVQLVHPDRPNPPVQGDLSAPPAVKDAIVRACYDCHSNQTRWPWYSAVAPVSWWIHYEVKEGRNRMNFSSWTDYTSDPGSEDRKLDEIARLTASGSMPPWYYLAMHPTAHLSEADRTAITRWIDGEKDAHAPSERSAR